MQHLLSRPGRPVISTLDDEPNDGFGRKLSSDVRVLLKSLAVLRSLNPFGSETVWTGLQSTSSECSNSEFVTRNFIESRCCCFCTIRCFLSSGSVAGRDAEPNELVSSFLSFTFAFSRQTPSMSSPLIKCSVTMDDLLEAIVGVYELLSEFLFELVALWT